MDLSLQRSREQENDHLRRYLKRDKDSLLSEEDAKTVIYLKMWKIHTCITASSQETSKHIDLAFQDKAFNTIPTEEKTVNKDGRYRRSGS